MFGYIYVTTNLINGKKYIGKRQKQKFDENYYGSGIRLVSALKKYGKENFVVEIIDIANNLEELNNKEKYWISYYNAMDSDDYYNLAAGGDGGYLGEEACRKAGEAHKGKHPWNYGLIDCFSQETREKMRLAKLNKHPWNYGKTNLYTKEFKNRLSDSAYKNRGKKVMCIETGIIYENSKIACIELGLDLNKKKLINRCCCGHRKNAFDLHWKYVD